MFRLRGSFVIVTLGLLFACTSFPVEPPTATLAAAGGQASPPAAAPGEAPPQTAASPTSSAPPASPTDAAPPPLPVAGAYEIGSPALTDVWVDPIGGDDSRTGATRAQALQTVAEAWNRIPMGTPLTGGYRIMLVGGAYPPENLPNYWESRYGTFAAPILVQAADGPGTATLAALNIFDTHYLYLLDLTLSSPGGDVLHCEQCDHFLVRGVTVIGADPETFAVQETVKINQSQSIFIENSDFSGAWDNALDFVAVQSGHVIGSRIHNAGDWCEYAKGGSAYLRIEGNEYFDCGTGGFTAGQGTGFQFMVPPWLHYEAYDIKVVNNIFHDIEGACLGVNGAYNILMAFNTCYKVGTRSHVIEFVHGSRSCDGGDVAACQPNLDLGGWGTTSEGGQFIPSKNIFFYNNVIYNPAGTQSQWQHFTVAGPLDPPAGTNVPSPSLADEALQIRGNVIWNGPSDHPLGLGEGDAGCQPTNPTCNPTQVLAENAINQFEPQLADPENGDFRPAPGGNLFGATTFAIPNFSWDDAPAPPTVPAGNPDNRVPIDRDGNARVEGGPPGAYGGGAQGLLWQLRLPVVLANNRPLAVRVP